ncbi:MAG TPA: hypothetical protein VF111_11925 [Thermoanaerobaculia bacterium]
MFGKKRKVREDDELSLDGGQGRGVPLGGHDDRPPTGYRNSDDQWDEHEFGWEDGDPADRRKDPLRR